MRLRVPLDKLTHGDRDVDESCALPQSPSGATSCGSARSLGSSGTMEETQELGPDHDDEAWRPLALAARDAMRSLEAALLAQETALFEVGLLQPEAGSSSREAAESAQQAAPESGAGGPAAKNAPRRRAPSTAGSVTSTEAGHEGQLPLDNIALSERWRALRHAVDARSLHWRLQVERHKTETLSLELEMRKRHTEELEKDLEKLSSLAVMWKDGGFDDKVDAWSGALRRLMLGVRRKTSTGGSCSSGAGGTSAESVASFSRRLQGSSQNSARHARIARPVPRGGSSARGGSGELLQGLVEAQPAVASSSQSTPKATPTRTTFRSPTRRHVEDSEKWFLPEEGRREKDRMRFSERRAEKCVDAVEVVNSDAAYVDESVWTQTSCQGLLPRSEDMLPTAGTGESASAPPGAPVCPPAGNSDEILQRFEAMQLSHHELEAQLADAHCEIEDRNRQLAAVAAELGARDVRVSALRHEVRVRDALLGRLHEDSLKRAEHKDHEVEQLVEQAMLPLTTILSSRQAATAAAVGERSLHAH